MRVGPASWMAGVVVWCLAAPAGAEPPNLLVVLADDLGEEYLGHEKIGPDEFQPPTPQLDKLARRGTRFTNFWVMPLCSPTRCALLTGDLPWRHGIGGVVHGPHGDVRHLPAGVPTLPGQLREAGYSSALLGKWHLGSHWGTFDPIVHGFDLHHGTKGNLSSYDAPGEDLSFPWSHRRGHYRGYVTTDTVDDALQAQRVLPEPWFLAVALHAPHRPHHVPPQHLHQQGSPEDAVGRMMAMVEALDTELGRLFAEVDLDRTVLAFLSDNGADVEVSHLGPAKGTTTEPGVNVPLIVAGPGIEAGRQVDQLLSIVDLPLTLCELAGAPGPGRDGRSFARLLHGEGPSLRDTAYAEKFGPDFDLRAARTQRYKLRVDWLSGRERFYDLDQAPPGQDGDPLDLHQLSDEQREVLERLRAVVALPER